MNTNARTTNPDETVHLYRDDPRDDYAPRGTRCQAFTHSGRVCGQIATHRAMARNYRRSQTVYMCRRHADSKYTVDLAI